MIELLNIVTLTAMVVVTIYLNLVRNMIGVVMLGGVYSLLTSLFFFYADAVDVAFTEAAVGAGISTIIFVGTIALTHRYERKPATSHRWFGFLVVGLTAIALLIGTADLPAYGELNNPVNNEIYEYYIAGSYHDIHIPNVVTSVLGSYRGYDTFGEVVVVFAAVVGVLALLWQSNDTRKALLAQRARQEAASKAANNTNDSNIKGAV